MPSLKEQNKLVFPGDLLIEGNFQAGKNTFKEGSLIYSSVVGTINNDGKNIFVTAIKGRYIPAIGDKVIGKIIDVRISAWTVDINSPYNAVLFTSDAYGKFFNPKKDEMTDILDMGDIILASIKEYDRTQDPVLTIRKSGMGKLSKGHLIKISPSKMNKIMEKEELIKDWIRHETNCNIILGNNGFVLLDGENPKSESSAILNLRKIENNLDILKKNKIEDIIKKGKKKGNNSV